MLRVVIDDNAAIKSTRPVKLFLLKSKSTISGTIAGTPSVKALSFSRSDDSVLKLKIDGGIGPYNMLWERSIDCNCCRLPMPSGILALMRFRDILSFYNTSSSHRHSCHDHVINLLTARFVREFKKLMSVPVSLLSAKFSSVSEVKKFRNSGTSPERSFPSAVSSHHYDNKIRSSFVAQTW